MYTNKLFDSLTQNAEVVVRYAKGKYAKGKVTKTTKTQLTVEFVTENGRTSTERFNKSNGEQIGGGAFISKEYGHWNDDSSKYIPERLTTYAEADKAIAAIEADKAVKAEKRAAQQQASKDRFNSIVEKTRTERENSLVKIDEETNTYKIVITSERGTRLLGIFTLSPKEYYNFGSVDTVGGMVNGFGVGLTYSTGQGSWPNCGTQDVETFEDAVNYVVNRMYEAW